MLHLIADSGRSPRELSESVLKSPKKGPSESNARSILAFLVRESSHIALEDLGNYLNRHPSGLSRLATNFEKKIASVHRGKSVKVLVTE